MKAIQVTCPHCGARLRANETSTVVTCEYCGTASAIQRRTRILERVMPPPPVQSQQPMRIAVQTHTGAWKAVVLLSVLVPVAIGLIGAYVAMRGVQRATSAFTPSSGPGSKPVPPSQRPPSWQGTEHFLIADVDGDGTPEIIGRGRQVNAGDIIRVLALDLATGKVKWQTEPIGTYTDTYRGPLALAGDMIVFASDKAELQTFALATGARRWRSKLDERVAAFCAGDGDTLIAVGADDMLRTLSRADGSEVGTRTKAANKGRPSWERKEPCRLLPSDRQSDFGRYQQAGQASRSKYKKHGIDTDAALPLPDGGLLLSGARREGTRVTTLVALDAKGAERWRVTASADPLAAENAPRHVAVGDREMCLLYYTNKYRLSCFSHADGKRLWDADASGMAKALTIIGRSLIMTSASRIDVRDAETGAVRWSMD